MKGSEQREGGREGRRGRNRQRKRNREKDRDTTLKPTAPIVFPVVRAAVVGEVFIRQAGGRQVSLVLLVVLESVAVVVVCHPPVNAFPVAHLRTVLHSVIPLVGVLPACFE